MSLVLLLRSMVGGTTVVIMIPFCTLVPTVVQGVLESYVSAALVIPTSWHASTSLRPDSIVMASLGPGSFMIV
jgi:hypothetical protein